MTTRNPKSKKFEIHSSETEVYEQEVFYRVTVEDGAGVIEENEKDQILKEMFSYLREYNLAGYVHRKFGEYKNLNLDVRIVRKGRSILGKVKITKKSFWERVQEALKKD